MCNKVQESENLLQVNGNFGCLKIKKIGEVCRDRTRDLTNACFKKMCVKGDSKWSRGPVKIQKKKKGNEARGNRTHGLYAKKKG